jgi:formate dehydrogenase subunit delta
MAQKAATLGIGMLPGVSAPTGLAVRLAETAGITLAGFVRRQRHGVYAHAHGLLNPDSSGASMNTFVKISNQIGNFFDSMPERGQATMGIGMHLKRFWAPSMRRQLLEQAGEQGAAHLRQIVRDAISRHADLIR